MTKRYVTIFLMAIMLFVMMPFLGTSAFGQTRRVRRHTTQAYYYKRPNFYRRHRKAINIGGGAAGGALVGGLIGGRKGALIGGLAGAGGGAYATHKQRPKNHYTRHYVHRTYRNY